MTTDELNNTTADVETGSDPVSVPDPVSVRPVPRYAAAESDLRLLVLLWCVWLGGSWAVAWGLHSLTAAARLMIFSITIGMMAIWPAIRLSQDNPRNADHHRPPLFTIAHVFIEWLFLVMVYQTVVLSLQLTAGWDTTTTLSIDMALTGWSLITSCIVAIGCLGRSSLVRTLAMLLCLALLLGEPALMLLPIGAFNEGSMRISPIELLWRLAQAGSADPQPWLARPYTPQIIAITAAGVVGWLILLTWATIRRITSRRATSSVA